jgi:hypothetical protein
MAGLSFRAFFKLLALLLPAALLSVFLGTSTARANTLEKAVNADDTGARMQLQLVREANNG